VFNAAVKERAKPKRTNWKNDYNIAWCYLDSNSSHRGHRNKWDVWNKLAIRNEQGKEQTWSLFWTTLDDARIHVQNAIKEVNANDFCAARDELAVAEVYLDLIVFKTAGLNQLGEDYRKLCDEGIHYIHLLKPTLSRIREAMSNGKITEGQQLFMQNLDAVLYYLMDNLRHATEGPYTIDDLDANINRFKALAETA